MKTCNPGLQLIISQTLGSFEETSKNHYWFYFIKTLKLGITRLRFIKKIHTKQSPDGVVRVWKYTELPKQTLISPKDIIRRSFSVNKH